MVKYVYPDVARMSEDRVHQPRHDVTSAKITML
jgi:hypothetical protein